MYSLAWDEHSVVLRAHEECAYPTDQFHNRDALNGYRGIGEEILRQLEGEIHGVCMSVGVGGAFIGTTQGIKKA